MVFAESINIRRIERTNSFESPEFDENLNANEYEWQNLHDLLRQMWMVETYRNSASSTGPCVLSACTNVVPMIKRMMWENMISPTVNQKYSGKCKRGAEILTIENLWHRVVFKCTSVTSYPVKMVFNHKFPKKTTLVSHVAAQWEQPFVSTCVLLITLRTRAIDRFLCLRH